ncbi:MAG: hypothetical protein GY757_43215, partial [bacterium]|nr:hypothetical protein [bacterium]
MTLRIISGLGTQNSTVPTSKLCRMVFGNKMKVFHFSFFFLIIASGLFQLHARETSSKNDVFTYHEGHETTLSGKQKQQLFLYESMPTTAGVRISSFRFDLLESGKSLNFKLFDKEILLKTDRIETRGDRNYTWFGKDDETQTTPGFSGECTAILVVDGDDIVGTIRADGELYRVRPLDNGLQAVIHVDQGAFPGGALTEDIGSGTVMAGVSPTNSNDTSNSIDSINADNGSIITLIVAYTPAAASQAGNINSLITLAVAETNQSYANSGINPRLQLVHKYQTDYNESSLETDRNRFWYKTDGYMDEVHTLRDTYYADVAVLIAHDYGDVCGYAASIMATESSAFCVVAQDCATGYYSFAHEIGHLQGARHNTEMDPGMTPFSYGHGFHHESNTWRTIMCRNWNNCERIQYWSNPDKYYNGVAMGTASTENNARVLNETAYTVANFRSVPPYSITVLAPNGGEQWKLGSSQNITWQSQALEGK